MQKNEAIIIEKTLQRVKLLKRKNSLKKSGAPILWIGEV